MTYDRWYRRNHFRLPLSTSETQVSHSELESIKETIIQHLFLFSGDDILNKGEPKTGKTAINNLKGV